MSIEESVSQIRLIGKRTDRIVATSHFYPNTHNPDEFISRVDHAAEALKSATAEIGAPEMYIGAEVLLCEALDRLEGIERLCIRGTRCMLIEMPNVGAWSERLISTVESLMDKDITVVLAHIDRYIKAYEDGVDRMLAMGAKAQINASSLVSFLSRRRLEPYLESGAVWALGSDLHRIDEGAYRDFVSLERKIGKELYSDIMKKSERLLEGAIIL
jgi:tyrosine-protein phosphatase YwqE